MAPTPSSHSNGLWLRYLYQLSSSETHRQDERGDAEHDIIRASWLRFNGTTQQLSDGYTSIIERALKRCEPLDELRRSSSSLSSLLARPSETGPAAGAIRDFANSISTSKFKADLDAILATPVSDTKAFMSDADELDDSPDMDSITVGPSHPERRSSPSAITSRSRSASPARITRLRSSNAAPTRHPRTANAGSPTVDLSTHALTVTEAAGVLSGLLRAARLDVTNKNHSDTLVFIHQPLTDELLVKHSSKVMVALGVQAPGESRSKRISASRFHQPHTIYLDQNCAVSGCIRNAESGCSWQLCYSHCVRHGGLSVACDCSSHAPLTQDGAPNCQSNLLPTNRLSEFTHHVRISFVNTVSRIHITIAR